MIKFLIAAIATALSVATPVRSVAKTYTNAEFGFSVTIPDHWRVREGSPDDKAIQLIAQKSDRFFVIYAYHSSDGEVYSVGRVIDQMHKMLPPGATLVQAPKSAPGYNLLRHWAEQQYRTANGEYARQQLIVRNKTLLDIYATGPDTDFSAFEPLFDSLRIERTHWGNFVMARNNIGYLWGSLLLSLFPLLGWFCGFNFKKWRRSCRTDHRALLYTTLLLLATVALFALVRLMLRDDGTLLGMVTGVMLLLWILFATNNRFFRDMYNGMFG